MQSHVIVKLSKLPLEAIRDAFGLIYQLSAKYLSNIYGVQKETLSVEVKHDFSDW